MCVCESSGGEAANKSGHRVFRRRLRFSSFKKIKTKEGKKGKGKERLHLE